MDANLLKWMKHQVEYYRVFKTDACKTDAYEAIDDFDDKLG